ncbi:glycosyltransferase family 32 protein [Oceanimonas doudoroffii]|uniref:Glycosyl transferase n=1 Tax=Oceanimonas doudoroffii TaxID=84158 RepID=A0A233RDS4_9GAMM|nr:glycosyltransferase [Oceanimonas doudoroffii]OXY81544.1 glycosyl transferase [Oceanimonas doudoroffii]
MKAHIVLANRLIRLVANLTKVLSYGFHYVFPNKRFTLPARSAPLIKGPGRPIPRIIWQTNYTDKATLPVYLNYLFNRIMSPTFEYRFMITEARAEFIQAHYSPEIFAAYSRLQIGAAQADFWRLLVLHKYGGVYLDIDAHAVWPLGYTIRSHHDELYIIRKNNELTNYFIASKPDNPNLAALIDRVLTNIRENTITGVYDMTGPGVFNQVLDYRQVPTTWYRHTCSQGSFTNEYFQYIDKPQGKWTKEQHKVDVVRRDTPDG